MTWHESVKARAILRDGRTTVVVDDAAFPYSFVMVEGSPVVPQMIKASVPSSMCQSIKLPKESKSSPPLANGVTNATPDPVNNAFIFFLPSSFAADYALSHEKKETAARALSPYIHKIETKQPALHQTGDSRRAVRPAPRIG
jgi:hypothetical protein